MKDNKKEFYVLAERNGDDVVYNIMRIVNDKEVGFVRVSYYKGEKIISISNLYVDPLLRGLGIGDKMLSEAIRYCNMHKDCKFIEMAVGKEKINIQEWYERRGFRYAYDLDDMNMLVFKKNNNE